MPHAQSWKCGRRLVKPHPLGGALDWLDAPVSIEEHSPLTAWESVSEFRQHLIVQDLENYYSTFAQILNLVTHKWKILHKSCLGDDHFNLSESGDSSIDKKKCNGITLSWFNRCSDASKVFLFLLSFNSVPSYILLSVSREFWYLFKWWFHEFVNSYIFWKWKV